VSFYVYLHLTMSGQPFYVGKGRGQRSHKLAERSAFHKSVVAKHGVEVLVFPRDSEAEAIADEVKWIKVLRDEGCRLVNLTAGGDGASGRSMSVETKAKIAAKNVGRQASPETRARQSAAHRGKQYRLGVKDSPEARANVSAAMRGNRNAVGNTSARGFKHSAESRARMSEAAKQRPAPKNTSIGAWAAGRQLAQEHRAKIGAAIRAAWARKRGEANGA
jgi:hypothetical protein